VTATHDESLRVSDADRERAVASLRQHLLAGRLTLDEFSERVGAALQARVGTELARVQEGLPKIPAEAGPSRRKPARFTSALLGHVTRRGRLRLHRRTVAAAALGDLDFDLREATIDLPQTAVTVLAAFGNVDVYVPSPPGLGARRRPSGSPHRPRPRVQRLWDGRRLAGAARHARRLRRDLPPARRAPTSATFLKRRAGPATGGSP